MIIILGPSGTGKTASLQELDPKETVLLTPNQKPLPWKGSGKVYNAENKNRFLCSDFVKTKAYIDNINQKSLSVKQIIIEDLSHIFTAIKSSALFINDSSGGGFGKWSKLGNDAIAALVETDRNLRPDLQLIVIAHTIMDDKTGQLKLKVSGRLLEDDVDLISYSTFALVSDVIISDGKGEYRFITNKDGSYPGSLAKSPQGCLELYEPNNMKNILEKIHNYYN